jgi:hypothetical protein
VTEPSSRCLIAASTKRWIGETGQLAGMLDALEALPEAVPDRAGPDERALAPYSREAVLAKLPKRRGQEWYVELARERRPRSTGSLSSSALGTTLLLRFEERPASGWKAAFDLGDDIMQHMGPRIMSITFDIDPRPAVDAVAETIDAIIEAAHTYQPNLRQYGLIGLSPRTYFDASLVELIGRERIERLPVPHRRFENGGDRVDLVPEPWHAAPEELVEPWRAAMAILRESDVFSTIKGYTPNGTVIAKRGKRWPD